MDNLDKNIKNLYKERFKETLSQKIEIWKVLCRSFFQKHIREEWDIVDIGAGYCEFINNIKANKKYAFDINEDTVKFANSDVKVFDLSHNNLSPLTDSSVDIVFISNFLEHLKTKDEIINILYEAFRVLKANGKIMVLQPNIKYACKEYWDFFDHYIPLSDNSIAEALQLTGFNIELLLPKFLPYTSKNKLPRSGFLIMLYLKVPLAWKILGKQVFIIASKATSLKL